MSFRQEKNEKVMFALRGATGRGDWIRAICPFCAESGHRDTKLSLGVRARDGIYHCFRCGTAGKLDEAPDPSKLDKYVDADDPPAIATFKVPDEFEQLWRRDAWESLSFDPARRYAESRNIDRELAREINLHACDTGFWGGRIIVPVTFPDLEDWVGWVARLWTKKARPGAEGFASLPYLYPKGMTKKRFVYNHKALAQESDAPILVMEGVLDAAHYMPDAVAVFGKLSAEQKDALIASKRAICFVPDGDEHENAWALAMRFRFEGKRAGYVKLPPRVDPDEVDKEWLIAEALASLDRVL